MRRNLVLVISLFAFIIFLGCLGGGGGGSSTGPGLTTGVGVSGRVYFPDRKLYGGIKVLARNLAGKTISTVQTDGTGNFVFADLPGGAYDFVALSGDAEVTFSPTTQVVQGTPKPIPETPLLSITNVNLDSITSSSVHISFQTNQACSSQIDYGSDAENPRTQVVRTNAGTSHEATITGLQAQTLYSFIIQMRYGSQIPPN